MRSLSRLVDNIISDNIVINNNIIRLRGTEIKSSDSTCKIIEVLNSFKINFNKSGNIFLILA